MQLFTATLIGKAPVLIEAESEQDARLMARKHFEIGSVGMAMLTVTPGKQI